MAQYSFTHSCGHDHTLQLFGPSKDRQRKVEWLSGRPCMQCERAAQAAAAQRNAENSGLPALTGSEKQVAWALRIRDLHAAKFRAEVAKIRAEAAKLTITSPQGLATLTDALVLVETEVLGQTDARFWIDGIDGAGEASWGTKDGWRNGDFGWRAWIAKRVHPIVASAVAAGEKV